MSAHPTGQPPCPSSAPCAGCMLERETMYEHADTDPGHVPDFDDHERAPILPGEMLLGQWKEAER